MALILVVDDDPTVRAIATELLRADDHAIVEASDGGEALALLARLPVDLVILVLWPEAQADQFLPALAETCRAFREPQALRRLRAAATPEEFIETLQRHHEPAPDTGERP